MTNAWIPAFAGMTVLFLVTIAAGLEPISQGDKDSRYPRLSGDGRYVVFDSRSKLTEDDKNRLRDIYKFDRETGRMERIVLQQRAGSNAAPSISLKGRFVVFTSYPLSVIRGGRRISDIYVHDAKKGQTTFITRSPLLEKQDGDAVFPQITPDGRYLVFTSNSTNLVLPKGEPIRQVYLYNRWKGVLEHISVGVDGKPANRACGDARISADGRFVYFKTTATNIGGEASFNSLQSHLYYLDRRSKKIHQVDASDQWNVGQYTLGANGSVVVFEARYRNTLDPVGALHNTDFFIFNRKTGDISKLTAGIFERRSHTPTLSGDGRYLAFVYLGLPNDENQGGLIIYDRKRDQWQKVVSGPVREPSFSHDGRYVTFESSQENLIEGAPRKVLNIYVVANPYVRH